jgi:ATP-dependent RNA helicase DeaD
MYREGTMKQFTDFPISQPLLKACNELGFVNPTQIQLQAFDVLLGNPRRDFHGQAQTGTGKTLAFGIPLLQNIDSKNQAVQALIVAPTRELVLQITQSLQDVGRYTGVTVAPIYGGASMTDQIRTLKRGVQVVVGTPGRLFDHMKRKTLRLDAVSTLILDEADLMLDMGFREDIEELLGSLPANRTIWLFSATMKDGVRSLMREHMNDTFSISVTPQQVTTKQTKQYFSIVPMKNRVEALCRFVEQAPDFYGFVFCPTKIMTSDVAEKLAQRGYKSAAIHGDMSQALRNKVLSQFKKEQISILVATDVAARGIDISDVTHVINFTLPEDQESYVHRIGRTGRAGKEGTAITFINRNELFHLYRLGKKFNVELEPCDVPSLDALAQKNIAKITDLFKTIENTESLPFASHIKNALTALSAEDQSKLLISTVSTLLFGKQSAQDEFDFGSTTQMSKSVSPEAEVQELMVNVGLDDGITQNEVIKALKDYADVNREQVLKIRVIKRRSFVTVQTPLVNTIKFKMRGIKLGGRRVVVQLSEDTGPAPRRRGHGGREGGGRESGGRGFNSRGGRSRYN